MHSATMAKRGAGNLSGVDAKTAIANLNAAKSHQSSSRATQISPDEIYAEQQEAT